MTKLALKSITTHFLGTDEQAANSRLMDVGRQYLGTSEYADTPERLCSTIQMLVM